MADVPPWLSEMKVGDWARSALVARHGTIELMDDDHGGRIGYMPEACGRRCRQVARLHETSAKC